MIYQIQGIYEHCWLKLIVGMIKRDILEEIIVKKVIETQSGRGGWYEVSNKRNLFRTIKIY